MGQITLKLKEATDPEKLYQQVLANLRAGFCAEVDCDELLLARIRIGIAEGDLAATDLRVFFEREEISMSPHGVLDEWPKTLFSARHTNLTGRAMRAYVAKLRREEEGTST